jgi:hypothetical protein
VRWVVVRGRKDGGNEEEDAQMQCLTLDVEAGQVSAELRQRGIPAETRVHVLVEVPDEVNLPMAALAQACGRLSG